MKKTIKFKKGSGNVFADLGIPNPEDAFAKAEVVRRIDKIIKRKKLTQIKVAKILKIGQSKVSQLLRGYFQNFSLERLFRFLNDLGQDVNISITPSRSSRGQGCTRIGDSTTKSRIAALSK
jgi:predicted XRE-type DNA-binding protein